MLNTQFDHFKRFRFYVGRQRQKQILVGLFIANKEALPWITILLTRHCYYDFPSFVILSQTFEIDIPQEFTRW